MSGILDLGVRTKKRPGEVGGILVVLFPFFLKMRVARERDICRPSRSASVF